MIIRVIFQFGIFPIFSLSELVIITEGKKASTVKSHVPFKRRGIYLGSNMNTSHKNSTTAVTRYPGIACMCATFNRPYESWPSKRFFPLQIDAMAFNCDFTLNAAVFIWDIIYILVEFLLELENKMYLLNDTQQPQQRFELHFLMYPA